MALPPYEAVKSLTGHCMVRIVCCGPSPTVLAGLLLFNCHACGEASQAFFVVLCVITSLVVAVPLVILTPTISIGAGGWVAYGILSILCLVYLMLFLILVIKVIKTVVRILGRVGFDHSRWPVESGLISVLSLLGCCGPQGGCHQYCNPSMFCSLTERTVMMMQKVVT
ncbi:uncharacterized protein F5891DRAFT_556469 [Suillus fuscotomentosus]|uniref:Uncharacterized protein n=1 Tax=Suillus fuscotomentosus TaxID=1912939 RepID=A0AAD4EJP0_9AGAM|nr:uncharacterized protein F5891DRAFT_556469 [Suillus fuscotomentosus]KAG1906229.1 hypothetical protein F5891DRAFT_556469 [Suillus fuscotomentosus]